MPRHAPTQPTGARAPPNVNTARTWLARPGHVRGGRAGAVRPRCGVAVGQQGGLGPGRRATSTEPDAGPRRAAALPPAPGPRRRPRSARRAPSAPRPRPTRRSRLLPAFTSMVPSGRGPGPPDPAERAAPPPPQRRAAPGRRQRWSRGPLMGRTGGAPGPGPRGRRAGCGERGRRRRRAALLAGP